LETQTDQFNGNGEKISTGGSDYLTDSYSKQLAECFIQTAVDTSSQR